MPSFSESCTPLGGLDWVEMVGQIDFYIYITLVPLPSDHHLHPGIFKDLFFAIALLFEVEGYEEVCSL